MYIQIVPNRKSRPCILLREDRREGKKVIKKTLANLTNWPPHVVEGLRQVLRGSGTSIDFEIVRSLPHGHVAAVLGVLKDLDLDKIIAPRRSRQRDLIVAMIVARIIEPQSKLATARSLAEATRSNSLAETCGIDDFSEDDLYKAMDWLLGRQESIESKLARRHLQDGSLVLYDLTSVWYEGNHCPLAQIGYSRDGKKGKKQIEFGLLCDCQGRPVAVEVFEGNTADPATLASQIEKLRNRFGLKRVILVGDRGMITQARIQNEFKTVEGLEWISALRSSAIRKLVSNRDLDMSLFDDRDMAEIKSPEYPGERLIVCRNPFLAEDRQRTREELLQATEAALERVVAATQRARRPLRGKDKIALRVGKIINKYKMAKHFDLKIEDDSFQFARNEERIAQEAALDGFYVIRTSLPAEVSDTQKTVRSYKQLSVVENAFRSLKTVDLKVRPIVHRLENRVRAHV
ncbi:MAG: IS1634 family transposase, partial [Lentisphaerae bacterium]